MLKEETKIFFENLFRSRRLLNEAVSDDKIANAIQNYEFIYIYYAGDDTIERGYRTVRPFVLGTSTAGNKVVRAWQDKGKSDSLRPDSPRKRKDHEWFIDNDGKEKPGWRLFRVDKITSMYPTGKRFVDGEGKVLIPPLYNPNDKQMISIVASITPDKPDALQTKDIDSVEKPDVSKEKISKSDFDKQTGRFKQFYKANKNKREATAQDIENLYNVAKKVMKKSPDRYIVAVDNKGDFRLVDKKNEEKLREIAPESIVGGLSNLYSKYVLAGKDRKPEEERFFKQIEDKLKKPKK